MSIPELVTYMVTFLAVYVQLFFLVTFLQRRRELKKTETEPVTVSSYPSVAVIVPCWNEEKTVHGTVESLLALEYPKEKLEIIIVDDGSTDATWQEILQYKDHRQIKIFHKENGGKHTAVNFGIEQTIAEFIGCLDADSFVSKDALLRIMQMFQKNPSIYAVAPSIIIHQPKNILQHVQKTEYGMGIYIKKMLAFLNAIHVTPGPFSIFRHEVFTRLGGFKKAHNTEDMEIAYRMQQNHMKIEHCHTAHVFTVAPDTVRKLFKQRLRWIYGFIQNTIDYRHLIFKKQYGNFSFFTVPSGVVSISAAVYIFFSFVYNIFIWIAEKVVQVRTVGIGNGVPAMRLEWFYMNTQTIVFVTVILYSLIILAIILGSRLVKHKLSWHIISYVVIYSVIAPFWLMKAVWNTIAAKKPSWR